MATGDLPTLASAQYASTSYGLANLGAGHAVAGTTSALPLVGLAQQYAPNGPAANQIWNMDNVDLIGAAKEAVGRLRKIEQLHEKKEEVVTRRLVQVLIADPNENVPLEESLLYKGEQKLTDATDQELFYEIDINTILKAYNEKRVKWIDKKVKERTENLEPARIRDLKMIVVTVAGF